MIPDPIEEIRAIKRKLADACGNDIVRIVEETRRHQNASGRQSVRVPYANGHADNRTNNPLQRSGEIGLIEMENLSSPPAER